MNSIGIPVLSTRQKLSVCFKMKKNSARSQVFATIRGVETEGDKENGGYSKETFEKALKETIVRVKQNSIEYHLKNMAPTDMAALQRSVADKKALEELEKVHISID